MKKQRIVAVFLLSFGPLNLGLISAAVAQCETSKLVAADASHADRFGAAVAIDAGHAIIGAPNVDAFADSDVGAAYVFANSNGTWVEAQKLTASDAAPGDYFGVSVAVIGTHAIVGASGHEPGSVFQGSAYIFVNIGGSWFEQQKLLASDGEAQDFFGATVSIGGDFAVVGAPQDDGACPADPGCNSGSAYVFRHDDNGTPAIPTDDVWIEMAPRLQASDAAAGDGFGSAVSISGDNILIAAPGDDDGGNGSGAAYVFQRNDNGTPANLADDTWVELSPKLIASDTSSGDHFGHAVAISGDKAVISCELGSSQTIPNSGTAYFFHKVAGIWVEVSKATPHDQTANDYFGYAAAIDGNYAVIGARWDDDAGGTSGSAYLFGHYDGGTALDLGDDTWVEEAKLTAGDAASGAEFGWSVAMSGNIALVGARSAEVSGTGVTGAAYAFGVLGAPDCNSNGVNDACELYSSDCNGTGLPDDCDGSADFDGDGDLDLWDFASLAACFTGSCEDPPCVPSLFVDPCCAVADRDLDGDVDLDDYDVLRLHLTGPAGM